MGTLAAIWKRNNTMAEVGADSGITETDPYALRALPNDAVYFRPKRIDNSRLVRQSDPAASADCWKTAPCGLPPSAPLLPPRLCVSMPP